MDNVTTLDQIPETEKAYFAGIVDGEGSISVSFANTAKYQYGLMQIRFAVGNTNKDLIDWIQNRFGGRVFIDKRKPPQKPLYDWRCTNRAAEKILTVIRPYLVLKRRQAEIVSELLALVLPANGRRQGIPQANQEQRAVLLEEIRRLNSKGKLWYARTQSGPI